MGGPKISYEKSLEPEKQFNEVAHQEMLGGYRLLKFGDLLKDYQKKWKNRSDSMFKLRTEIHEKYKSLLKLELEVSRTLKVFLICETKNKKLTVSFINPIDKVDINEIELQNLIKEVIVKEFEKLKLNETECTREEGLEDIINYEDIEWLFEYATPPFFDGMSINPEFITDELINSYVFVHYKPREITLGMVNNVITERERLLDERKSKVGAKIKNLDIGELARRLSYLHVFEKFLNHNEFDSISDFPLSNITCRFIYDYFEFWGLLNDFIDFDIAEKEKRTNYIKSLIRNSKNFDDRGLREFVKGYKIIDTNLELRIDLFKKVKKGLLTREQYTVRMSALQR
jgi:hypothetical protein